LGAIRDAMTQGTLTVVALVPGDESHPQKGKVSFIDNAVDSATGTVLLKAQFDNPEERLWPGAHTEISLTVRVQSEAVVVPSQAIQQSQGGPLTFVIKDDNTVETRIVQVDRVSGQESVVAQGLKKGERVVVEGQLRLVNGAAVDVVKTLNAPKP
jgi:multidrug efflux system membrane fusion protein